MPMTIIDLIFGGAQLQGKKTIIGIVAYVALAIGYHTGAIPHTYVTPEIYDALMAAVVGFTGLAAVSKIERVLKLFVPGLGKADGSVEAAPVTTSYEPFK